jgi:hypothetical protein
VHGLHGLWPVIRKVSAINFNDVITDARENKTLEKKACHLTEVKHLR